MLRILHDGDLHARFWHWLDRFYYEYYRPWREMQRARLDAIRKRAATIMGPQNAGQPPALQWLPKQNPIQMHPRVEAHILAGQLQLFLWLEPYELPDTWSLYPGLILASFAEPGPLWESFEASATDVARRAKALADPTRLIILRLIRHFSLINTDLADYMGLARPTVSVHAKILREAGLIRSHQEGRRVRHEIVPEEVHRLFRDMQDFLDLPDED